MHRSPTARNKLFQWEKREKTVTKKKKLLTELNYSNKENQSTKKLQKFPERTRGGTWGQVRGPLPTMGSRVPGAQKQTQTYWQSNLIQNGHQSTAVEQCTFQWLISKDIAQKEMVFNHLIIHHLTMVTRISYEVIFTMEVAISTGPRRISSQCEVFCTGASPRRISSH